MRIQRCSQEHKATTTTLNAEVALFMSHFESPDEEKGVGIPKLLEKISKLCQSVEDLAENSTVPRNSGVC